MTPDQPSSPLALTALAAAFALAPCLRAQVIEAAPPPILPPIVNARALGPFFLAAETGRADVVCLGDSNQLFGNTGWDHGWHIALHERFGLYATGLLSPGENTGSGAGAGYLYQSASTLSSGQFQYAGAPPELDALMSPATGMRPLNYLFVPAGSDAGGNANLGIFLDRFCPIDVNAPLRLSLVYGLFDAPGGWFQLQLRQAQSPFASYAVGPLEPTHLGPNAPPPRYRTATLDVPGATRESNINLRITPWGQQITGPFIGYLMRAENTARASGASLHTLYAAGGAGARDMAVALQNSPDDALAMYFGAVRAAQTAPRAVLVRINTGLNDRNTQQPSVGPAPAVPGFSADAYADNLTAIIERIEQVWHAAGWSTDELFFLLSVSHPVSEPEDQLLSSYRYAAAELALSRPRTAMTNFYSLTGWGEMVANGWYQFGGFDPNHLTQSGFEALSRRELGAMEDGACWRDLNRDGAVDILDLYEWRRNPADLNGDGWIDTLDERCLLRAIRWGETADIRTP